MAKRLTYITRNGLTTAFIGGHKKATLQPYDYGNSRLDGGSVKGVWLHTGNYDKASGALIDSACTQSFRSMEAAKRYLSEATRFERGA